MSRLTYRHTIAASYLGYITQAITLRRCCL